MVRELRNSVLSRSLRFISVLPQLVVLISQHVDVSAISVSRRLGSSGVSGSSTLEPAGSSGSSGSSSKNKKKKDKKIVQPSENNDDINNNDINMEDKMDIDGELVSEDLSGQDEIAADQGVKAGQREKVDAKRKKREKRRGKISAEVEEEEEPAKGSKKKKKNKSIETTEPEAVEEPVEREPTKGGKKKKRNKSIETTEPEIVQEPVEPKLIDRGDKKKKKNKDKSVDLVQPEVVEEEPSQLEPTEGRGKKKKKNKSIETTKSEESISEEQSSESEDQKSEKKNDSDQTLESVESPTETPPLISQQEQYEFIQKIAPNVKLFVEENKEKIEALQKEISFTPEEVRELLQRAMAEDVFSSLPEKSSSSLKESSRSSSSSSSSSMETTTSALEQQGSVEKQGFVSMKEQLNTEAEWISSLPSSSVPALLDAVSQITKQEKEKCKDKSKCKKIPFYKISKHVGKIGEMFCNKGIGKRICKFFSKGFDKVRNMVQGAKKAVASGVSGLKKAVQNGVSGLGTFVDSRRKASSGAVKNSISSSAVSMVGVGEETTEDLDKLQSLMKSMMELNGMEQQIEEHEMEQQKMELQERNSNTSLNILVLGTVMALAVIVAFCFLAPVVHFGIIGAGIGATVGSIIPVAGTVVGGVVGGAIGVIGGAIPGVIAAATCLFGPFR